MKNKSKFLIIFITSFLAGILILYGLFYAFLNRMTVKQENGELPIPTERVNVLVIGVANGLSDTIMFTSFDMKDDKVDLISIPRDTYFPRKDYKNAAQKKINAVYGSKGAKGSVAAVEDLLNTDIHYYVEFDYEAVKAVVDAIGGIKVEVPYNMDYDDPVDNLHIHFKKGQIVKNGDEIIKLLRWRKNNKGGGYKNGDLGRIEMQQHIVKLGIEKLLKGNIVASFIKLQKPLTKYIKTDMTPNNMMYFAGKVKDVKTENISFHTTPGNTKNMEGLSFFVINKDKLKKEMDLILNINE